MSIETPQRKYQPHLDLAAEDLFGNDAGEDECPEVLSSYFIDQPAFKSFLSTKQKLKVGMSRKGMGKSALLSKLAYDLKQEDKKNEHIVNPDHWC